MDPFTMGASLLSAGTKLFGGMMSQDAANDRALANYNAQKEFAQQGVRWKVADAKAAGISPLAALGASTTSFSNVTGDDGKVGSAIGDMGQDITRAATASAAPQEKALLLKSAALDVEKKGLENDLLRSELADKIRKVSSPGSPPGFALPSTGVLPASDPRKFPVRSSVPVEPGEQEKIENQVRLFGINLANDPWSSDAQTAQNMFGDWGENMWTFPKIGSVAAYNIVRWLDSIRRSHGTNVPGGGKY